MTEKQIKYTFLAGILAMAVIMYVWLGVLIDASVRDLLTPWPTILAFFVMLGFEVLALEYIFTRIRSWKIGIIRVLPLPIMFIMCMALGGSYFFWFLPATAIIKIIIDVIIYWRIYGKRTLTTNN